MSSQSRPETGPHSLPAANTVGLIGLGSMGIPMALNLVTRGENLRVYVQARTPSRLAEPVAAGAIAVDTPRELAEKARFLILMLPDLAQINEVLDGPNGLLAGVRDERTLIICSSVAPEGVRELARRTHEATAGALRVIDAPVSGGTEGAAAGTLSIMVGGEAPQVAAALPVLRALGTPVHLGPLGAGQVAKACNQLIVAATMTAVSEAAVIAERAGIDLATLLPLLQQGYAGSRVLETKMDRIITRDYSPTGVAAFMVKDLRAAEAEAHATKTRARTLGNTLALFEDLVAAGLGEEDLAVMHRFIAEGAPESGAR